MRGPSYWYTRLVLWWEYRNDHVWLVNVWNLGHVQVAWGLPRRPLKSWIRLYPGWQLKLGKAQITYFGGEI